MKTLRAYLRDHRFNKTYFEWHKKSKLVKLRSTLKAVTTLILSYSNNINYSYKSTIYFILFLVY